MTLVSYTAVSTFLTCPREFYYRFVLNRTPIEQSKAITQGVVGHTMLESFYRDIRDGVDRETARQNMQHYLPSHMTVEMSKVWALVDNYVRDLTLEETLLFVEDPMTVPVADDLEVAFTIDLAWLYKAKWIELEDYKFIGRTWPNNKLIRYSQLDIYMAMLRKLGYPAKKGTLRFFNLEINKIQKKVYEPSEVKLARVYEEFVMNAWKVKDFLDLPLENQQEFAVRTLNYNTCQYCQFVYPCDLELEGKDASNTLATQYKENTRGSIALIQAAQGAA